MRISDWSSDVCSSDLLAHRAGGAGIADRTAHRTMHRAGGPCGAVTGRGFEGHNGHGGLQQSSVVGAIIACGRTRACARRVAASLCRSFPGNIEPIPYRLDTIRLSQILRPAFCQYGSRSLRLKILPESSRGSVAATSTRRGSLYLAMRGSRKACTSAGVGAAAEIGRHTSELQSLMRISYAVFCLKKKTK